MLQSTKGHRSSKPAQCKTYLTMHNAVMNKEKLAEQLFEHSKALGEVDDQDREAFIIGVLTTLAMQDEDDMF